MASPSPLASLRTFRPALELAQRLGLDALQSADVPRLADPGADADASRLPVWRYFALWDALVARARDPMLPARAGAQIDFATFGVLGYACLASPTLGEAFARLARFNRICTTAWTYAREDAGASIALRIDLHVPPQPGRDAAAEYLMSELWHVAKAISARDFAPSGVEFTHARPAHADALTRHFGSRVRFGAGRNALLTGAATLAMPLRKGDPAYLAFFERQAEALVARFAHEEGLTAQVRRLLSQRYRGVLPSALEVARALGLSERTLRRRLEEEGVRFQALADGTRSELARRYVAEGSLPLGEVAFLLGFSEPSAFHRAFKRWTGRTPLEFRRAAT